ncbi:hypothetical protein GGI25_003041 [Coemansia spiralis]|uniref:RGS domain-containing protein n=2 Tax=Coemansia TaxID=4863 RepID=A0A9W8G6V6_9FUNG|nr:hypothetical protein EDC05_002962 [Coemansia umbellata]KAJ2677651.1 hypothetical protein GGI25_003041 [Coemansia spiralis]
MPLLSHMLMPVKRATDSGLMPDGTHQHSSYVPTLQKQVYLWIGVIDLFLFTVSTSLFVYRGRRTLDINAHAVLLTSIGSFTILVVNTCFLFQFVWPGHFPCFIILWCAYPGVMLWMTCTIARALRLYILSYRNMQKLKERNKAGQMTAAQLYGKGTLHNSDSDMDDEADNAQGLGRCRESAKPGFWARRMVSLKKWWDKEKMQITERRLVWYTMGMTLFAAIVCAIIQAFTKDLAIVPMQYSKCPVGVWEYFPLYALTAFYCLVLTPFIVYHIWPIKDAFGIRHDILLNNLFTFVCIAMFMVQTNKGFGGEDPFWDSFLWCALLFNMSQFTSVVIPLIRSYRQSDSFTWSDNPGRSASKELFYRVLNHPELFEKLKVYSAANFCTEITLFLEEYQVLKANTVRFYNMGEPGFDEDGDDEEVDLADDVGHLGIAGHADGHPWGTVSYTRDTGEPDRTSAPVQCEKGTRLHLNGLEAGGSHAAGKHLDLESNPDTIISAGNSIIDYSDKAAMVGRLHSSSAEASSGQVGSTAGRSLGLPSSQGQANASGPSKLGKLLGIFHKPSSNEVPNIVAINSSTSMDQGARFGQLDNTASLAIGGAAIGNLPVRRNSRGEDIMVLSRIPPFTPVRYTVISTLMQTPAGLTRQGNMNTFKTLPFALRGDYYGFYSTFIADGATLQINVEGRISEAITRLIHSQQYTVDMMDEAHSEVLQLLYDNIFKKFVRLYHRDMVSIM